MKVLQKVGKWLRKTAFVAGFAGVMTFALGAGALSPMVVTAAQQETKASSAIRLGDVQVYGVKTDETLIQVPILAEGKLDLQCYDLLITYDSKMLELQKDQSMTGMTALEGYLQMDAGTKGELRLAGVVSKDVQSLSGQIGQLTFLLKGRVRQDGVTSQLGLEVRELGFDTDASQIVQEGGQIILNKSKEPKSTPTPQPTPTPQVCYYGDVNMDGQIEAADALAILKYVVKLPTQPNELDTTDPVAMALADLNRDGSISAEDALLALKVVVKLEEPTPYADHSDQPFQKETENPKETTMPLPTETAEPDEQQPIASNQPEETAEPSSWSKPIALQKGDMDENAVYSVRDALFVYQIMTDVRTADADTRKMADVNSDGELTEKDVTLLVQAAMGQYTSFGYEKPVESNVIYVDCNTLTTGEYCYRTMGEAVSYLNKNQPASEEQRMVVRIAPGTYREHTILNAPYVTFEAMYPEQEMPNITYYYGCGMKYVSLGNNTASADHASTVISKQAHDFIAKNLMFENSYNIYVSEEERGDYAEDNFPTLETREENIRTKNYQTQGLALRVDADRSQFLNCRIIGRQDTLLMNDSNRCYYEECYIEGTVDFIYGSGAAVFQSCTINSPYHNGHITAASTPEKQKFGFLFKDCVLTKNAVTDSPAPIPESYSLGRPWNGPAMVVYFNCRMDDHIATRHTDEDRFVTMRDTYPKEEARYGECGTMDINGNKLDLEDICPEYEAILTEEVMEESTYYWLMSRYNAKTETMEYDGWNPGNYQLPK